MSRLDELKHIFANVEEDKRQLINQLIEEVVFVEQQLKELRKMQFIKVHPENPSLQKATPASKQYKELMQTYNNSLKVLSSVLSKDGVEEESPLREFLKQMKKRSENDC